MANQNHPTIAAMLKDFMDDLAVANEAEIEAKLNDRDLGIMSVGFITGAAYLVKYAMERTNDEAQLMALLERAQEACNMLVAIKVNANAQH